MVTTQRNLLTGVWNADVQALESDVARFTSQRPITNDCRVAFFEIAGDSYLHVNVTHKHQTTSATGWAGPAHLPQGFVHNRRFSHARPSQVSRHIRAMVYADRIG